MDSERAGELRASLQLQAHPEGGWYREVYRSESLTTIYFMLAQGERSRWHRLESDEVWHFYEGDPLELSLFDPVKGEAKRVVISSPLLAGDAVCVVPAGWWQAAIPLGVYSLVGCSVAPAFEFSKFTLIRPELPEYDALLEIDKRFV